VLGEEVGWKDKGVGGWTLMIIIGLRNGVDILV
jgi:hypothetical protein